MPHLTPDSPRTLPMGWLACIRQAVWLLLASACCITLAHAQVSGCGELKNGFGPYDFLSDKDKLPIVEQHHFTPEVEMLVRGNTSVAVGADISYTLLAFPNHHRALQAMVRLGARQHTPQPAGATFSVECYFDRALRFRPHDTTARLLYANYLFQNQRKQDALSQMAVAADEAADNPFTHYNMGLMYLENQVYDLALAHARKAYDLGFTQPGLRDKLEQLGRWP
jgi:hypothetical protein